MRRPDLRRTGWTLFVLVWLAVLAVAVVALWSYKLTPGAAAAEVRAWPAGSQLPRDPAGPTLLVFLHPQCPCSVATLAELEAVMAGQPPSLRPVIVFYTPVGADATWPVGRVWDAARAIPRAMIYLDAGGDEARRFGATTSGHVTVFGPSGVERFAGGITPARGHIGDGPGRTALVEALARDRTPEHLLPVFGCELEAP